MSPTLTPMSSQKIQSRTIDAVAMAGLRLGGALNIASKQVPTDARLSGTTGTVGKQRPGNTVGGTLSCVGERAVVRRSFNTAAAFEGQWEVLFNYCTVTTPGDCTKCPRSSRHDTRLQATDTN